MEIKFEADAVYQLPEGKYALIEIKLRINKIPQAEKSLLKFKDLIKTHNKNALKDKKHLLSMYREPSALIITCAMAPMSYTTNNGVKVIPIGCLCD